MIDQIQIRSRFPGRSRLSWSLSMILPQIVANIIGALVCIFYFIYLDRPEYIHEISTTIKAALIMTGVLIALGWTYASYMTREVRAVGQALLAGTGIDKERLARARRQTLNNPLLASIASMTLWGVAAVFMSGFNYFFGPDYGTAQALSYAVRVALGTLVSGVATTTVVFYLSDLVYRRIRPLFFQETSLFQITGAFRLRVGHRILFAFLMVGVGPMILISALLYQKITGPTVSIPADTLTSLLYTIIFIPATVIATSVVLSRLVTSSIADPIKDMERAMSRVRQGDLATAVQVAGNDELGALGDAFNHMTVGLRERERMRRSLELARQVQQSLLPLYPPRLEGLDLAGLSDYCDETGGDYYDFLISPTQDREVGLVVGDVSDHGLQSALLMTSVRSLLRQRFAMAGSPAEIISGVNRSLYPDVEESGLFVTMIFCTLSLASRRLTWVNAGHDQPLLYDRPGDAFVELSGRGPTLGVLPDFDYRQYRQSLAPGQILALGTDGIWECHGRDGEMFGKERFKEVIRANQDLQAEDICRAVTQAVADFRGPIPQEDDITLLLLKVL